MEYEPTSTAAVIDVCADDSSVSDGERELRVARRLTIGLEPFAWEALEQEAARLKVSIEELASFGVLYYLADGDTDASRGGCRRCTRSGSRTRSESSWAATGSAETESRRAAPGLRV